MRKPKKKKPQQKKSRQPQQERVTKKPEPSFRASVVFWFSATLAAFTLFNGLQPVLDLADWARVLVKNWTAWNVGAWSWLFSPFNMKVYPESALILTFLVSIAAVSVAAQRMEMRQEPREKLSSKEVWAAFWSTDMFNRFLDAMVVATGAMLVHWFAIEYFVFNTSVANMLGRYWAWALPLAWAVGTFGMLLWFRSSRDIGHLLLLIVFISGFYFIISLPSAFAAQHDGQDYIDLYRRSVLFLSTVWIPLKIAGFLTWARPRYFNYRFTVVLLTLGSIVALNYVSLLGLSLKAPT